MNRRKFIVAAGSVTGAVLFGKMPLLADASKEKKPNILLIMTDEHAADAMSWRIGNKYLSTPVIDSIASGGTFFTNAYCANPLCVPSRTSLFTGLYPHQTGVQTNSDKKLQLSETVKNMGRIFRDSGYDTGYIGKWHMAFPIKNSATHGFDFMRSNKDIGADQGIPSGADEFLKIKRDKPFLLVTSFVNPHNICEWARGDALPDCEIDNPPAAELCPPAVSNSAPMEDEPDIIPISKVSAHKSKLFPVGNFDEKKWREYRWAYYRMIEKVDSRIGQVIQSLKDSGQYENTLIVFTSDHGDMQGAHGWNQKTVLFEEATKVPLIISEPGKRKKGLAEIPVNTGIDMLPTLCGYAGIILPPNYPGISLQNIKSKKISRDYIVVENKMIQGEPIDGYKPEPSGRMVRGKKYKYCIYDIGKERESLVDLESDPGEMKNLSGKKEYQKELNQYRRYLKEWSEKYSDSFPGDMKNASTEKIKQDEKK